MVYYSYLVPRSAPLKSLNLLQTPKRRGQIIDQLIKRTFVCHMKMNAHGFTLPITPDIGNFTNGVLVTLQIEPDGGDTTSRAVDNADPYRVVNRISHSLFQNATKTGHFADNS